MSRGRVDPPGEKLHGIAYHGPPMADLHRRRLLALLAGAGPGAALAAALPAWIRDAAAATPSGIVVRNDWPEHWETSIEALGRNWITPNDVFFARSHFPVPEVDPRTWRVEIAGLVEHARSFSLQDLRALPPAEHVATLECAGNGRALYNLPSTSGTQWQRGAVGTAHWRGVALRTLLERARPAADAQHVWFEGADAAPVGEAPRFVRSIPLAKAQDDVLLAHTMNGTALPRLHGGPLRAVVPGWFGMAWAKWVTRIRLEAKPSDNHFMVRGYRYTYPGDDPAAALPVETMRVKSLITRPLAGARVPAGMLRVRGFAWAGPDGVRTVEVSGDGGLTWQEARLTGVAVAGAWQAWEITIPVAGPVELLARATDARGETQPASARANAGGYGNNSIHRVKIDVTA